MKTDMQLKSGGIDELARDSSINATGTGAMVKDGAAPAIAAAGKAG